MAVRKKVTRSRSERKLLLSIFFLESSRRSKPRKVRSRPASTSKLTCLGSPEAESRHRTRIETAQSRTSNKNQKKNAPHKRSVPEMVPEVGLEPTSLAAEDFLPTSAFAADAVGTVRGLEHAFTLALQP